jgi:hypothetical protein
MKNIFRVLQVFAAFFVTLLGLAFLFKNTDPSALVGAALAATGLTFLTLLAINVKR